MIEKGEDIRSKDYYKQIDSKIIKAIIDVKTNRQPVKVELFITPRGKKDCTCRCWISLEDKIEIDSESEDGI